MGGDLLRGQELAERQEQGLDDYSWLKQVLGLGVVVSLQMLVTASLSCRLPRPRALGATDPVPHHRRTGMIPDVSHSQVSDSSKS